MINLNELKAGDRLVAGDGHPSFTPGQVVEVVRVQRGDVLVPGEAEDGSDTIRAEADAFVAHGGRFGPVILAVRCDGGIGRSWVRASARHREDRRLREEDTVHHCFTRASEAVKVTAEDVRGILPPRPMARPAVRAKGGRRAG